MYAYITLYDIVLIFLSCRLREVHFELIITYVHACTVVHLSAHINLYAWHAYIEYHNNIHVYIYAFKGYITSNLQA